MVNFVYVYICKLFFQPYASKEHFGGSHHVENELERVMLYLKILFLVSYFIIIFVCFRAIELYVSSLRGDGVFNDLLPTTTITTLIDYFFKRSEKIHPNETGKETLKQEDTTTFEKEENKFLLEKDDDILFVGYEDYIEKVEDTKASIWVVQVFPTTHSSLSINKRKWSSLSRKFKHNGIKTGSYNCHKDIRLCLFHKITTPSILLSMPKGSHPKGNVAFYLFKINQEKAIPDSLFKWVKKKLYPKVKTVHSISELIEPPVSRLRVKGKTEPSMFFVYESNVHSPPLLLTALSVRFTGRIKFYMLKSDANKNEEKIFAINKFSKYSYGNHTGENFTYSCMELFLRTLHPEVNDIFIASVVLLNMACWLEVSLQKGGPLRRLLFYFWGFMTSNILLFSVWVPLIQLIYMPQVQPILEVCLKNLQNLMFTNIAAIIRQDLLQLSQHIHIVFAGFVCYGIFLGYLHYRFRNEEYWENHSFAGIFEHDINDLRNIFHTFLVNITPTLRIYRFEASVERILQRLSTSNLWLPTDESTEYIKVLPTWKHCTKQYDHPIVDINSDIGFFSESDNSEECLSSTEEGTCSKKCIEATIPAHIFPVHDCVICLEKYKCKQIILGAPCGHSFHRNCVLGWLLSDGAQNRCPICRWPCNVVKGKLEVIDLIE